MFRVGAYTHAAVVRVRSDKPGAVNSRKNRAPPPRAIFKDGKVSGIRSKHSQWLICQRINPAVAAAQAAKADDKAAGPGGRAAPAQA